MSSHQQIANSFVTEFFERLAKNPADLAELYGQHSSIHINDFELGITEAHDADVPATVQSWAAIVQNSKLRVESVNSAPVYGGVNVFVTLSAVGQIQQYFQITTTLEGYSAFNAEGYYIRAQVISRIGALESPPVPEPEPEPAAAPSAPAEPEPTPAKVETPKKAPAKKPATPAAEEVPAPQEKKAEAPPAPAKPAAPKSWASLASAAPSRAAAAVAPIRVVAHDGSAARREEPAPREGPRAGAPARESREGRPPRERRPERPVGERLMFNMNSAVTDDEIKAALGSLADSLVSLRTTAERTRAFMDFAEGIAAYEELTRQPPALGATEKMIVYHQRPREERH